MPDNPPLVIATRQKADLLFSSDTPLGAGETFTPSPKRVVGYDSIAILAISDQAFAITVEEACEADGQFAQTETLSSALVAGVQQICTRIRPCGAFMVLALGNLGAPMGVLDFCAHGVPLP